MPSKVYVKSQDRDLERPEPKERRKRKSSRSRRKTSKERDDSSTPQRSSTLADPSTKRRSSMPIPELQRRSSLHSLSQNESKASLPYPTFSKAHSREAVGGKEDVVTPRQNLYTPDPTDLHQRRSGNAGGREEAAHRTAANIPPSPPLTAVDQPAVVEDKRRDSEKVVEEMKKKLSEGRDLKPKISQSQIRSSSTRSSPWRANKSGDKSAASSAHNSKPSTPSKMKPRLATVDDGSSLLSISRNRSPSPASSSRTGIETATASTIGSDATSIAPQQHKLQDPFGPDLDADSSPTTQADSSPRTPTPRGTPFPPSRKETPACSVPVSIGYPAYGEDSPMPPPPPPPPAITLQAPKVDYLMQYGGLPRAVSKGFLSASEAGRLPHGVGHGDPDITVKSALVEKFFAPFNSLLEDYRKVMAKNGSLAVATGYRSIARRLLDRLEAVFARDISSEVCECCMCQSTGSEVQNLEDERGISWGEILEYVCGRRDLPPWPPFTLDAAPVGLGILAADNRLPMQKLDVDVPEEYREHYIRQSKKTKLDVDRWLAGQSVNSSDPPEDADDDTLTFAMLTHLEPDQRPIFKQFLGVGPSRPISRVLGSRAPTPLNAAPSDLLNNAALAIQRLYRLTKPPRHPESAIFLVNNSSIHNVLATIAAVTDGEWDILTSGRFDGFLRSGAEDSFPAAVTSPPPSRGPTPLNGRISRGPTASTPAPASVGAPVAMDEETEIATLADVEQDIFHGMEALEDAFEALHTKAEEVRQALRERAAGLAMASQARRGGLDIEARLGTPASGVGFGARGWDSETDDGIDDGASELAPDDSASNVSSSRYRRPKRRNERRTPAPVEEEDEEEEINRRRVSYPRNSRR